MLDKKNDDENPHWMDDVSESEWQSFLIGLPADMDTGWAAVMSQITDIAARTRPLTMAERWLDFVGGMDDPATNLAARIVASAWLVTTIHRVISTMAFAIEHAETLDAGGAAEYLDAMRTACQEEVEQVTAHVEIVEGLSEMIEAIRSLPCLESGDE